MTAGQPPSGRPDDDPGQRGDRGLTGGQPPGGRPDDDAGQQGVRGVAPTTESEDRPIRVTTLELFFDLIFAFTLTQLAGVLALGMTGLVPLAVRVLRVLLIFGLLWWMYGGFAWLTNSRAPVKTPERLLLVLGMAGFLIVGLAIPSGFGKSGVALGLGYLLVVLVHAVLYARVNRQIWRIAPFNVTSALLVTAAGFAGGVLRYALWAAALIFQACAPLLVRLSGRFDIRPAHFAERHGALILVAIGESVAAIGIGASNQVVDPGLVVAAIAGLALAVVLWWMYFGSGDDEHGERAMRAAGENRRPGLALSAYFYAHMPMLLGIVFAAAGVAEAILVRGLGHLPPGSGGRADLPAALVLGVGAAAFAGGTAAFRAALRTAPVWPRLWTAIFALATIALGALVALEVQLVVVTVGLAAQIAFEARRPAVADPPPGARGPSS